MEEALLSWVPPATMRTMLWAVVLAFGLWLVERRRHDLFRLRTQVAAEVHHQLQQVRGSMTRTSPTRPPPTHDVFLLLLGLGWPQLEEASHSQEVQDALLEDRKARALAALLRILDAGKHPLEGARRGFRVWKVRVPRGAQNPSTSDRTGTLSCVAAVA